MKNRRNLLLSGACGIGVSAGLMAPAIGQQGGGINSILTVQQGIESTRNPTLTPGNDDVRTVLSTELGYGIKSETRRSELELNVGARLRYAFGDVSGPEEGFDVGRETVSLSYSTRAPRARFDAVFNYLHDDLSFLNARDLISLDDGKINVTEDFTDLVGTGTRERISYRLSAQFDQNGPFGWGATLSGTDLNFSNTSSNALEDSSTYAAALNAHFDVTESLRIDTRAQYLARSTETVNERSTTSLSVGATSVRSDKLTVRGRLTFAAPDDNDDRLSLTAGMTKRFTPNSHLSFDLGASTSDDLGTQLIGRFSYDVQPTAKSRLNVQFSTDVTDSTDNQVVVNTVALIGADFELTPVSSLSLDAVYANEDSELIGQYQTEFSTSLQLKRKLSKDWQMSVGVSHTSRRETGLASAHSEEVFINFGRSWTGRF